MTQAEVMPTLRKNQKSSLWNFQVSKWTAEQIKEFKELRDGKKPKIRVRHANKIRPKQKKPVIRLSDGKIYESISECARDNKVIYFTIVRSIRDKKGKFEMK